MMTDTCGAVRDVALLPIPYQGCVAPESAPITWISTEVVFAHIPILFVCLFWPLQAIFSRNWFWLASHIVSASFSILSHILTSWQKLFLDAVDSRGLPVHRAYIHTIHNIPKDVCVSLQKTESLMLWPVPTSPYFSSALSFTIQFLMFSENVWYWSILWPVPTSPHFSSPFSFTELIKGFAAPSYLVEKASTAVYLLNLDKTSLTFYSVLIVDGICQTTWLEAPRSNRCQVLEACSQNCWWWTLNHLKTKCNVS